MSTLLIAPTAPSVATAEQVRPLSTATGLDPSFDVIVIGTGAGGAVFGTECAKAGLRVLFLESGGAYHLADWRQKSLLRATRQMYQNNGLQFSLGAPPIVIPQGRVVGGSTVLNSAIVFRPPDERLDEWADFVGDDRLRPAAMRPFVDEIWRRIGAVTTHPGIGQRHNMLFREGAERVGLDHHWMDRNAPGCIGCGICHLGCPSGGKASVDKSILPEALNHGAQVMTHARAQAIIVEGGRAKSVLVDVLDPETRARLGERTLSAPVIAVAGSALGTPVILHNTGVQGHHVGAHLSLHSATALFAEFPDPVVMWKGVPQGYYAKDPDQPNIVFETQSLGLPELHALLGAPGKAGADRALRYPHLALAGAMLRDVGGGTVRPGKKRGERSIRYDVHADDVVEHKKALKTLARVYFAAGAKRVAPIIRPVRFFDSEQSAIEAIDAIEDPAGFAQVYGSHPHGSARMGKVGEGVCDGDGKVHGVEGLYIADGSLFPSTLGVNPQVTIMALSLAIGRRLAATLKSS